MCYLGLDLSTQSVTCVFLSSSPNDKNVILHTDSLNFDKDLPSYETTNGMHIKGSTVTSPVMMWLEGLDRLLKRQDPELMSQVIAISGSAQQHGSVYLAPKIQEVFQSLQTTNNNNDQRKFEHVEQDSSSPLLSLLPLEEIYKDCFTIYDSPIWADSSTTEECLALENSIGGAQEMASLTGSRSYCRFTGVQYLKKATQCPELWQQTKYVGLVSSFLSSLLVSKVVGCDYSDASGMNLMNLRSKEWDHRILEYIDNINQTTASKDDKETTETNTLLQSKLASSPIPPWSVIGTISTYFHERYNINVDAKVICCSGDNPCSLVGMGLRTCSGPSSQSNDDDTSSAQNLTNDGTTTKTSKTDIVVSLGTSDTLLGLTADPQPKLTGNIMCSPVKDQEYFVMLVYKNGAVAREALRNEFCAGDWDTFSQCLTETSAGNQGKLGCYLKLEEITPPINKTGYFRSNLNSLKSEDDDTQMEKGTQASGMKLKVDEHSDFSRNTEWTAAEEIRACVEGRFLSMKARSKELGIDVKNIGRILATGGASNNRAMMQVLSDIFNAPVFISTTSDSAAVGAALRAKAAILGGEEGIYTLEDASLQSVCAPNHVNVEIYSKTNIENTGTGNSSEVMDMSDIYKILENSLL